MVCPAGIRSAVSLGGSSDWARVTVAQRALPAIRRNSSVLIGPASVAGLFRADAGSTPVFECGCDARTAPPEYSDAMKTHALPTCPACGSTDALTFDLGNEHLLKRCNSCRMVSALSYADPEEIYTDDYFLGKTQWGLGFDIRHPLFQQLLARIADRRIELIEGVTGGPGRILDVGSGMGEVLLGARKRGWTVQGVEPERVGAETAIERGIPTEVALLEESGIPERSWDVVSAFHVLEHIPDALGFVRMLARWAKPGGHVAVEVPNFASVQRRRLREAWVGLRPLQHIGHFTPETLERMLRGAGLEPQLVRTPAYVGPPQNLDHAITDLARGRRVRRLLAPLAPKERMNGEEARIPSKLGWAALQGIEALYDRAGVGTVVFAVARVP